MFSPPVWDRHKCSGCKKEWSGRQLGFGFWTPTQGSPCVRIRGVAKAGERMAARKRSHKMVEKKWWMCQRDWKGAIGEQQDNKS